MPKNRFAEFNLDPALAEAVEAAPEQHVLEGIIRLEDPDQIPPEFRVVSQFIRVCTGRFLAEHTWNIRQHPNVVSLKAARSLGISQSDNSAELVKALAATGQIVNPLPFTGRGSIVAALDFGLDFGHPNFINPDGTTRVSNFWHQGASYDVAHPNRYGYGRVFSADDINTALQASDPYHALGYHPAISDTGKGSHGTHTLDIAAGNGRAPGSNAGIASEAELMFVHLSTPRLGIVGDLGDSVRMLEALDFVHRTAGDRPCVVNLSVGREAGSHDATSPFEQAMHELLRMGSGTNRAICQSAGNYGSANLATNGWLRDGEQRDLKWIVHPNDASPEIDAWYSGNDRFVVELLPPDGADSIEVKLGAVSDVRHNGSLVGRVYHRKNDPNNRDNHVEVFLYKGAPPGAWTLRLIGEYVITGRFHAWIERAIPGAQSHFDPEITSRSYTLGTIATSPLVITVGAYDANIEWRSLAPFSSCGPTRDERQDKPELLAPGVRVLAARSIPRHAQRQEGLLMERSGTSMATPHATGAVAAMFEAAGRPVSISEIRECLKQSAEPVTDVEHPNCCAWGRLNIQQAIDRIRNSNEPPMFSMNQVETITPNIWFGSTDAEEGTRDDTNSSEEETSVKQQEPDVPPTPEINSILNEGKSMNSNPAHRFLDSAEQALLNSLAERRQSEASFLQHLLRELGGQIFSPELSPAGLFRAAVKDWPLMQSSQNILRILALPSRQPEAPLRAGDWMVRVVTGTGDVGHVAVLASGDLVTPSALSSGGIVAESTQPGYYGIVIESGTYPHNREEPFARRFLDARGRAPAHTVILRPQWKEPDSSDEYTAPAWLKIEQRNRSNSREPYLDFGGETAPADEEGNGDNRFDSSTIPKDVADALAGKDWPRALRLAIQAGWHDENKLTNLIFFTRHPELSTEPLDPKGTTFNQLSSEWSTIRDREVRPAIEKASEDTTLKVSGNYVAERDRQFWGKTGKKFRELVEWAAGEVDLNPGFLGAVLLAEWDDSSIYLSPGEVRSFLSGTDDFFEARAQLAANVAAFSEVHFDITKKTTNTNEHGRVVTTIPFNSGKDALLATAVYLKYGEIKLRKGAKKNGGDFDKLPAETRFALVRIAMAAGHGGIDSDGTLIRFKKKDDKWVPTAKGETGGVLVGVASRLDRVLAGEDILVRKNEPRQDPTLSGHVTDRNATILAAQALHLSDWIFGKPQAAASLPKVQESESWSEAEEPVPDKFAPPSWLKIQQRSRSNRPLLGEFEDSEDFTFEPTAEQTDFGPKLRQAWHAMIQQTFQMNIDQVTHNIARLSGMNNADAAKQLRFFSPSSRPPTITLSSDNVVWSAFPISFGPASPKLYKALDEPQTFRDGQILRVQDEYCEWRAFRNSADQIVRVVFTSEPPEYYQFLYEPVMPVEPTLKKYANDLLVRLYQERCGTKAITLADLEITRSDGKVVYHSGNKWNNEHCVHLQQPNNNLGAEINIAARAAVLRGSKAAIISNVKTLINCGGFGDVSAPDIGFGDENRRSDPAIGNAVNKTARENRFLTLENPVGLYMMSLDTTGWKTKDGTDAHDFWKVLKGKADKDPAKSMIVRAEYAVPAAKGYTVSDIKIGGNSIEFGGQIAEHVQMRLGVRFGPKDTDLKGGKIDPPAPVAC